MTGPELRKLRQAAGLSGQALADKIGVHRETVYRWERGQRHISTAMARLITMTLTIWRLDDVLQ